MHNRINDLLYSVFPKDDKYLTFGRGETNVILSAPHGGGIKPINIPSRKYGNRSCDTYTRRLIQKIIELSYKKPYYIYADIHRSRVDLNRDIQEGAQGNLKAERIWNDWNTTLDICTDEIRSVYERGLYIDIHSHNNSNEFQIGYGLDVKTYLDIKSRWIVTERSTMYPLKGYGTEYNTLFGNGSFPHMLKSHRFQVLTPQSEKEYLNGGRNIRHFSGKGIGALQIECPISVLRDNLNGVADVLTLTIDTFQRKFMHD